MSAPTNEIIKYDYQNPDASAPLVLPMMVVCNTSDEDLSRNVQKNSTLDLTWVTWKEHREYGDVAIMIGGGGSVEEYASEIEHLRHTGGTVFAMNGASKWATDKGINVDYQVIADAKAETAILVDPKAKNYLLASQVHGDTMSAVLKHNIPTLWHLETGEIEKDFPEAKVKRGGYALIGGGASVGNSSMCVAYTLGFREIHVFGYDSSHKDDESHAYPQPMNDAIPCVQVKWGGKEFKASVAMKAQAEKFQMTSQALKQHGCELHVYGEGLLQTMYRTEAKNLTEQEKYQTMWQFDMYRENSPGEKNVDFFYNMVKPDSLVIDFGCGTGRAALALHNKGLEVLCVDFASNSRDEEAMGLPFLEWDLTQPIPSRAKFGYCTDVMEHIPMEDVQAVLRNIMDSAETVFFQISTIEDVCGAMIGADLHLSVYPHDVWAEMIRGFANIAWSDEQEIVSSFYVTRKG